MDRSKTPVLRLAIILGILATFGPFGTDMYLSGFPTMAGDLGTDVAHVQITLSVYFLGLAIGQLLYGPIVDRMGRRKPLIFGLCLFTAASLLAVFAKNIQCLLALRLCQALGGCAGMIVGRAVVRDLFDLKGAANLFSMLALVQGLGPIVAPILGSCLLHFASWRWVFVFLALFGVACLLAVVLGLPESLPKEKRLGGDFKNAVADYWFLMRKRAFIVPALAGGIAGSSLFAYISASPFVFMTIYGVGATTYGMIFAGNACGTILAAQLNRILLRRTVPYKIFTGAVLFNIGAILLLFPAAESGSMALFMIPLWFTVASVPMMMANSMAIAMSECGDKAGIASAIIGLLQFGLASLVSYAVSLLHNGTAYPMAGVMLGCVVTSALVSLAGNRKG
jgi:MFS transporter, DHA1 family, multidrug resistance protein